MGAAWTEPVGIAFENDPTYADHAYVWERGGKVWIVEDGVKAAAPLVDISEEVGAWRDHGMLGFALDPNFRQNGYIYLLYVVDRHHLLKFGTPDYSPTADEYNNATIARLTRYTANAADGFHSVDPASRKVLIGETKSTGFPITFESHGVGTLAFGTDGTLLVSCGESASYNGMDDGGGKGQSYSVQALADGILSAKEDVGAFRAQLVDSLGGKVLRIDPATGDGVASNPFYDAVHPRAAKSRVWAMGLRNPFRMTLLPETGSHNAADSRPGVILLGDVGWGLWEEIDVIDGPGQNLGWPLFEGLTQSVYMDSAAVNKDAPNPLGGFFRFKDLLVQDTAGSPSWPNPTNPAVQVPATVPRFVHHRPAIDIGRNAVPLGPVRTGIFNGNAATEINIGAPGAPISGPQFTGLSSIGGTFYEGHDFPSEYHDTYFHADFDQGWIKNIVLDANHHPVEVRDFATVFHPVFLATHPVNGTLYYVSIGAGVRQIIYAPGGNQPPVAAASVDQAVGSSPLTVNFSSAGSKDPDGQPLTYLWDFGDGDTSTDPNPIHTFIAPGTTVRDVKLTVLDSANATAEAHVSVFVNHTLPQVAIVSPLNGAKYSIQNEEPFSLVRSVTEVPGHPTTTTWQAVLHHNNHEHADPPVTADSPVVPLSAAYSPDATFYYRVLLTVTDDLGATVQKEVQLQPNTSNVAPAIAWSSTVGTGTADGIPVILDASATISDADSVQLDLGSISVASTGAAGAGTDRFAVLPEGDGAGQVNVVGNSVRYEGREVALTSGGSNGQPLVIAFNSIPTPAIAQALLRRVSVAYAYGGTHTISATLDDGDGGSATTEDLAVTVVGAPELTGGDIGAVTASGSASISGSTQTLTASGAGMGGTRDEFFFFSRAWRGDGEIIAHLSSLDTISPKTFAGVMFREKANATSKFALLKLTAGQGAALQWRSANAAVTTQFTNPTVAAPQWLRLVRHGLRVTAYTSPDAQTWAQLGTTPLVLPKDVIVGLAASSAVDGQVANAAFDHVILRSLNSPTPPLVRISSPAEGATFTAPANIAIDAQSSDPDGGVARVELYRGATKLAIDTKAPFGFILPNAKTGAYTLTAKAYDFAGLKTTSAPVSLTVSTAVNSLPTPWNSRDIGASAQGGSSAEASGVFTTNSTGLGIGTTADQGRLIYRTWSGNGTFVARITSLTNDSAQTFAGITFRESLAVNARQVTIGVTSASGSALYTRAAGAAPNLKLAGPAVAAPQWVKIVRKANSFAVSISPDGASWTLVATKTIAMAPTSLAGLYLGAKTTDSAATAVFDQVTLTK